MIGIEERSDSSLGTMFLVRKAAMEPLVNTSFHGSRMSLAERSVGCQEDRADVSLFLMVGYTISSLEPRGGNHGWSQVWMGVVSVRGFHNSTSA